MTIGNVVFGFFGFCLFMLGGKVRTTFLYAMFILCVASFASLDGSSRFSGFLFLPLGMFCYASAIAQNAKDGGSIGKIGMWWWMLHYAAMMRLYTAMPWRFCWKAAECAVDSNPDWQDDTPREAVLMELSYWTD